MIVTSMTSDGCNKLDACTAIWDGELYRGVLGVVMFVEFPSAKQWLDLERGQSSVKSMPRCVTLLNCNKQ